MTPLDQFLVLVAHHVPVYGGQWLPLFALEGTGWGTLGRWSLFLAGFVLPIHLTLRWRSRA